MLFELANLMLEKNKLPALHTQNPFAAREIYEIRQICLNTGPIFCRFRSNFKKMKAIQKELSQLGHQFLLDEIAAALAKGPVP